LNAYGEGPHARTMALMAIVGTQLGHTFNCRSRTRTAFDGFFRNPYVFAAAAGVISLQLLAIHVKPLANLLDLVEPNWNDLYVILGCVILPVLIVETQKAISRSWSHRAERAQPRRETE